MENRKRIKFELDMSGFELPISEIIGLALFFFIIAVISKKFFL